MTSSFPLPWAFEENPRAQAMMKQGNPTRSVRLMTEYTKMFIGAIRPSQLFPTLKREKYIKKLRPPYKDYIYVWVLASSPDNTSIRGLTDIRDHLFGLSERLQLPILIETTVEKVFATDSQPASCPLQT